VEVPTSSFYKGDWKSQRGVDVDFFAWTFVFIYLFIHSFIYLPRVAHGATQCTTYCCAVRSSICPSIHSI